MCRAVQLFLVKVAVIVKPCTVSVAYNLNKSPPDANAKLKNQRIIYAQKPIKDCQADVGFCTS
jgi:hypothetical protein